MNFTPSAAAAFSPPCCMALKYGMPTICGTKATVLCASSAARVGPDTSARSAAPARSEVIPFDMGRAFPGIAGAQSRCNLERTRVGMGACDERNDFFRGCGIAPALRDLAAAAEDRHPVGDFEDVDQVVRNQHDGAAAVGEAAREIQHLAGFG